MKKNTFFTRILLGILFVSVVTSCENYLDVNTDPNNPTTVTPDLILPVAQNYTAQYMHGDRRASHLGNMIMYNWSESQGYSWYDAEFQYNVTTTFYNNLFDVAYTQPLKQYELLTDLQDNAMYSNYAAIGWIMKAYHFQLLVDFYGDVPYTEALQRQDEVTPVYDDQQEIYADLIVKLNAAIDLINSADPVLAVVPGDDDGMFGGDMTMWKQFANTLKIRIINRMSGPSVAGKRNEALLTTEMDKIMAEGSGFITDDVEVNPGYLNEENKQNPFYASWGKSTAGANTMNYLATSATQYIIDYLTASGDPRLDRLYEEPATGHRGVEQGVESTLADVPDLVSNVGPGLSKSSTQSSVIFTLAEHNLNMAELSLKFADVATAAMYLEDGIEASFAVLGATDNAYDENVVADFNAAASDEERLEIIITEKWIATNGMTAEQSWFDWTRTGYPSGLPLSQEALHDNRPYRLFYPASEQSANTANVPSQPDAFSESTKIFWAL